MAKSKAEKEVKKTECPITRQFFEENSVPVLFQIGPEGEKKIAVGTKEFATGSLGWYHQEKTYADVGGVKCRVQLMITMTLIGSKEAQ